MGSITELDYMQMKARTERGKTLCEVFTEEDAIATGQESKLHASIIEYLDAQKLAFIHSPTHRKATQTKGSPDFVVYAPGARVLSFEVKTRTGKRDDDQIIFNNRAEREGHEIPIVRSMKQFLHLMNPTNETPCQPT